MALTLIANLDPGLQCRNTLNAVIDLVGANHPWTSGSIPYTDSTNDYAQDNSNFFWDAASKLLTSGNGLKIKGTTSGIVTVNTKAVAGTWALTLPDSAGTSGSTLMTDGAGVTSWFDSSAAVPWTPTELTTVHLWLKADTLTGSTGDPISTWSDVSGEGNDATQTGSNRPTLQVAHQNGLNVVRLTAANAQSFVLPNVFTSFTAGAVCFVCRMAADPGVSPNADHGLFHFGGDTLQNHYPYATGDIYDDFASSVRKGVGNPATSLANYHIGGFRSKAGDWRYFLNGTQFFSTATNTVGWRTNPMIGTTSGGDYFDGYVAEIILMDEFASTEDWQMVEGYLAHKWGLLADLDPTHPYKIDPPMVGADIAMVIGDPVAASTPGRVLFIGAGNVLADDSTFTWDNILKDLAIGGIYYVNAERALYAIPATPENNWFEGGAGNQTVSGYGNLGTGDNALQSVTTGYRNVAIGTRALQLTTAGYGNFAFGFNALGSITNDYNNTAVGSGALQTLGYGGAGGASNTGNVAIGFAAGGGMEEGSGNIAIGYSSLAVTAPTTSYGNTIIGSAAAAAFGTVGGSSVNNNMFIGAQCGKLVTYGNNNVWVGGYQGQAATYNNTIALSTGDGIGQMLDCSITTNNIWTLSANAYGDAGGLHLYNYQNVLGTPTNYERLSLDWHPTGGNVMAIRTQAGGTGTANRMIAIGAFPKAGAPASGDLPSGTFSVIDDTSANKTWLAFNKAGTIRQTEIGGAGGGGGMAIGGVITGGTAGRVLFAGAGGILDDDSMFTWNDSLKDLAIGGAYYVNAAKALYVVPHVSGNNWFEGNSGNLTMLGYDNFATGDLALGQLTSGYRNVAVGASAGKFMTSGAQNFAMGSFALWFTQSDSNNVAIGYQALATIGIGGVGGGGNYNNIAIGFGALGQAQLAYQNVVMGFSALANVFGSTVAYGNTILGSSAAGNLGTGGGSSINGNTFIGSNCGLNISTGSNNVWFGGLQGLSASFDQTIAIASGNGAFSLLDCHYRTPYAWSFHPFGNGVPISVHFYNYIGSSGAALFTYANYERAILDWQYNTNMFNIGMQAGGTGVKRLICIDGFAKAGAPAAGDLKAESFAVIDDTSAGQTWLVFNKAGAIRKVQLT